LRLVALDDTQAKFLYRNLLGILILTGFALVLLHLNRQAGGGLVLDRIGFCMNLIVFVWLGVVIVKGRAALSQIVRGRADAVTPFEQAMADYYPQFAVAAVVITWVLSTVFASLGFQEELRGGLHLISLVLLLMVPLIDALIRAAVRYLAPTMQGDGDVAEGAYTATLGSYKRMGRVVVFGVVVAFVARLWDISLVNIASAGLGQQVATHLLRALLICVVGYLAWEAVRLTINRKLARERTVARISFNQEDSEGEGGQKVSSRLATVLPPVSWTLQAIVITMTVLTALGNIGIDVTPLLAGAGVEGIAIGFGAQKLVSDIVSGVFFLVDDAFRLNEYIDAGGTVGTVEKISLRSVRLRDDNGPLYCIPYSEMKRVTNFGRDWGIMKLKFTVPFDTDPEKVRKIFKKIGQEMLDNPELADGFIEPFKSQGVKDFNDTGMVVRGKFKFRPGTQFPIRKEIYRRVQQEFAAQGIEFARKEVRVTVNGVTTLTPEQTAGVAAAAAEAAIPPKPAV
jgi:moderate conductance mechanosensitive channel